MSNKPNTKRAVEAAAMTKDELSKKIAAARGALTTALLTGDPTAKLREYIRELEVDMKKLNEAAADQQAAQQAALQALAQIEADRIAEAAATIKEARNNRIAAIATRFAIPARPVFDSRDSFHA
ncbi:hypothetical protein PQR21_14950 [Paraburkholderia nemoris]|uniref:hypothetical protein n=1 Tax=Paraburkholderia nemoris TaxID=2793076 RepID=UPI0038B83276